MTTVTQGARKTTAAKKTAPAKKAGRVRDEVDALAADLEGRIWSEVVEVDRAQAGRWLSKRDKQRPFKEQSIEGWSRDMIRGDWHEENEDPIRFDVEGNLRDGQNRMKALVLADEIKPGITIRFKVIYNCTEEMLSVVDTGNSRSWADNLSIKGYSYSSHLAQVGRACYLMSKDIWVNSGRLLKPTVTELDAFKSANPRLTHSTARGVDFQKHSGRLLTPANAGIAHFALTGVDNEQGERFFDMFLTGAYSSRIVLEEDHPIRVLRDRLASERNVIRGRLQRPQLLALIMRTWNYYVDDEKGNLLLPKGKLTNDNFPRPKLPKK